MKSAIIYDPVEEFRKYVEAVQDDGERHTKAACDAFDLFCYHTENIDTTRPDNHDQEKLQEYAMDAAVEYEESGFIAGMRWAFKMVKEHNQDMTAVEI